MNQLAHLPVFLLYVSFTAIPIPSERNAPMLEYRSSPPRRRASVGRTSAQTAFLSETAPVVRTAWPIRSPARTDGHIDRGSSTTATTYGPVARTLSRRKYINSVVFRSRQGRFFLLRQHQRSSSRAFRGPFLRVFFLSFLFVLRTLHLWLRGLSAIG